MANNLGRCYSLDPVSRDVNIEGPSMTIHVTLDTNILDREGKTRLSDCLIGTGIELACVTVSERELQRLINPEAGVQTILETAVLGESHWGGAVWADTVREDFFLDETPLDTGQLDGDEPLFESIVSVISSGSFPKPGARENLSKGERRQLRDAMILMAHCRDHRDIFVTEDRKGFVSNGNREALETLCRTKIMTLSEFEDFAAAMNKAAD